MWSFLDETPPPPGHEPAVERLRAKYASFRELLALNNESLELMAALQEDLRYVLPRREVLGDRIGTIFGRIHGVAASLERLTGTPRPALSAALADQQREIERYSAGFEKIVPLRLFAWLSDLSRDSENEAGSKAAALGEIRNRLLLPVPDAFIVSAEAYRGYCETPLWEHIRDQIRSLDLADRDAVLRVSEALQQRVMEAAIPQPVESVIRDHAAALLQQGGSLAVRSSAHGEGGALSFAGQFLSLLNVSAEAAVDAYRRVVAARFSERALFYRLSNGLLEVDCPMPALFMKMVPARASGIMYTRDPADPKSKTLWITATRGLCIGIASGRTPSDLFLISRATPHPIVERQLVCKEEQIVPRKGGGIESIPLEPEAQNQPSIQEAGLRALADWGIRIEEHFRAPQDIEWVEDEAGALWIVQTRPLANAEVSRAKPRSRPKVEPKLAGGRAVYPGRTSGPAFLLEEIQNIGKTPAGAVVFIRKPSPEIVQVLPRIAGLVAEWGNIAGHAAALLREFKIPSVFQMPAAFDRLTTGEPVSLDAVQARLYAGILWPAARKPLAVGHHRTRPSDPVSTRLLTLNLQDPSADNFRPAGCRSGHDVLRYCHEKAIETMFEVHDRELERDGQAARKLKTQIPLNVSVIDLGGGILAHDPSAREVTVSEIVSRPFQALWKGISHPEVTWTRQMPASISALASILTSTLTPQTAGMRPLGEKSYLLVADEYMNLNARLAYHYSLVDACISDIPGDNYISFRFEGGGAAHGRRSLRACFLERCLAYHGFQVHRRTDLVNAWFRKAPADQTSERLDLLGRLLACSNQLDMYMTSSEVMNWFADQFISGNYAFRSPGQPA